jgi:hypothetical protein
LTINNRVASFPAMAVSSRHSHQHLSKPGHLLTIKYFNLFMPDTCSLSVMSAFLYQKAAIRP